MSERRVKFCSIKRKKRAKVFRGYKPSTSTPAPTPASTSTPAPTPSTPATAPTASISTPPASTSTHALASTLHAPTPAPTLPSTPLPTSSDEPVAFPTRSSKKIALSREARDSAAAPSQPGPSSEDNCGDYHLIKMSNLKRAVSAFSCCGSPLSVTEDRTSRRGFVVKMALCVAKSQKLQTPTVKMIWKSTAGRFWHQESWAREGLA